eukprot:c9217_g1_i1.p1 GENE.c9217_g1_i1~~c9217_g1_i1.p1  ORF type:complete len:116 (+),score=15.80 c9217_g1_i1:475-822(+)
MTVTQHNYWSVVLLMQVARFESRDTIVRLEFLTGGRIGINRVPKFWNAKQRDLQSQRFLVRKRTMFSGPVCVCIRRILKRSFKPIAFLDEHHLGTDNNNAVKRICVAGRLVENLE